LGGRDSDDPLEKQWSDTRRDVSRGVVGGGDFAGGARASGKMAAPAPPGTAAPGRTGAAGRQEIVYDEELALYRRYGEDNL
jgi:hypothetical protein